MDSRNILYAVVGALVIAVAVLGYKVYQDKRSRRACRSMSVRAA